MVGMGNLGIRLGWLIVLVRLKGECEVKAPTCKRVPGVKAPV